MRIPWARVGAEGAVIVASILLAFAIDRAWETRRDHDREQDILLALEHEMVENRENLTESLERHARGGYSTLAFLDATPAELAALTSDSAAALFTAIRTVSVFSPSEGILRGEDLSVLNDPTLRWALGTWLVLAADQREDHGFLMDGFVAVLKSHADHSLASFRGIERDPASLASLRSNDAFARDAAVLNQVRAFDRRKLEALLEQTNLVLQLIEGSQR